MSTRHVAPVSHVSGPAGSAAVPATTRVYLAIDATTGHLYETDVHSALQDRVDPVRGTLIPSDDTGLPAARSIRLPEPRIVTY